MTWQSWYREKGLGESARIIRLQRLAVELVDEVDSDKNMSARCRALPAKLFSPEAAVRQIVAALGG